MLPPDSELTSMFHMGLTNQEIADYFKVSRQAVSKRLVRLGLVRRPYSDRANKIIGRAWKIKNTKTKTSHHCKIEIKYLRWLLRRNLGDQLNDDQNGRLDRWIQRIKEQNIILCYDPNTLHGFYYRERQLEDGDLAMDWPRDVPLPEGDELGAIRIPGFGQECGLKQGA